MSNNTDKPDVSNVNVDEILDTVVKIMERMLDNDMKKLKEENNNEYLNKLEDEFQFFVKNIILYLKW